MHFNDRRRLIEQLGNQAIRLKGSDLVKHTELMAKAHFLFENGLKNNVNQVLGGLSQEENAFVAGLYNYGVPRVHGLVDRAIKEPFGDLVPALNSAVQQLAKRAGYKGASVSGFVAHSNGGFTAPGDSPPIVNHLLQNTDFLNKLLAYGWDVTKDERVLMVVLMELEREQGMVFPFFAYTDLSAAPQHSTGSEVPSSMINVAPDFSLEAVQPGTPFKERGPVFSNMETFSHVPTLQSLSYYGSDILVPAHTSEKIQNLAIGLMTVAGTQVADKNLKDNAEPEGILQY